MANEFFTAWISKYALTEGIRAWRVRDCGNDMVQVIKDDGQPGWGYFHKGDWHRTHGDAAIKANRMRLRKIISVKKQLTKLEALSFSPPTRATPGDQP